LSEGGENEKHYVGFKLDFQERFGLTGAENPVTVNLPHDP